MAHSGVWGSVRAVLPLLLALLMPLPAAGGVLSSLVDQLTDPRPPLGRNIRQAMEELQVDGQPLGPYLEQLQVDGCLDAVSDDLVEQLDVLRRMHVVALEHRRSPAVWATWERHLTDLGPEAYLLVTTWLDSPATARRLYLCDDGLPPSWKELDPDAMVIEAVTWFDVAVAEREHTMIHGAPSDRELAIMQLWELRDALNRRFDSTYPADDEHAGARERLQARLDLMWETLVAPYHTGFTPRARAVDAKARPGETGRAPVQTPFTGLDIPDPQDVAYRDRVVNSWRRQRQILRKEAHDRDTDLAELRARIAVTMDPDQLDRLVRRASRLEAASAQAVADLERLMTRVRHFSTGQPGVDRLLRRGAKRRAVKRLDRRQDEVQQQRDRAAKAVAEAVDRGAAQPGTIRAGAVTVGRRGNDRSGDPGPGNWLAGLPAGSTPLSSADVAPSEGLGSDELVGLVQRRYEGPLPTPSGVWSDDLVQAVRGKHPSLDETDVRILLGLVQAAYRELPDRMAVEAAVWRSLATAQGLSLRGEEASLSELWVPGLSGAEQPAVTFILTLNF